MTTPNIPIVNAGTRYVNQVMINWISTTTFGITSGASRDFNNSNDITIGVPLDTSNTSQIVVNTAVIGYNGIDVGALAASTRYYIYLIYDSTKHNPAGAVISSNSGFPVLPFGYDTYRRIGSINTNGSSLLSKIYQFGNDTERFTYFDAPQALLAGGTATTFTAVQCNLIPGRNSEILCKIVYTCSGAGQVVEFLPFGSALTTGTIAFGGVVGTLTTTLLLPAPTNGGAPTFLYKVGAGDSVTITAAAYKDYLNVPS